MRTRSIAHSWHGGTTYSTKSFGIYYIARCSRALYMLRRFLLQDERIAGLPGRTTKKRDKVIISCINSGHGENYTQLYGR